MMVQKILEDNKEVYVCEACGYRYQDEQTAKACQDWCSSHQSCNIEITSKGQPPQGP